MKRKEKAEENLNKLFKKTSFNKEFDPEYSEILQNFVFGEVYEIAKLDDSTKELVIITALTTIQTFPQLRSHIRAALNIKTNPIWIREAIYQCTPYIGFPRTINAINVMNEVFLENGINLPLPSQKTSESVRYEEEFTDKFLIAGSNVYSTLEKHYEDIIPDLKTELEFEEFLSRGGLEGKTRFLLALSCLITMGHDDESIRRYTNYCFRLDVTKEEILSVLVLLCPYVGFPKIIASIQDIRDFLEE